MTDTESVKALYLHLEDTKKKVKFHVVEELQVLTSVEDILRAKIKNVVNAKIAAESSGRDILKALSNFEADLCKLEEKFRQEKKGEILCKVSGCIEQRGQNGYCRKCTFNYEKNRNSTTTHTCQAKDNDDKSCCAGSVMLNAHNGKPFPYCRMHYQDKMK
jgi:hypothetical protein